MEQIIDFIKNSPVSWVSILVFAVFQLWSFLYTVDRLLRYRKFFSDNNIWKSEPDGNSYQIAVSDTASKELAGLVSEINEYLVKNEGTTDFNIIKDKTERKLDTMYEDATSRLSFPTYLGLMGTFFGVFIGLWSFNIGVETNGGNISDASVSNLIYGIIVSMVTSLVGLILMIISRMIASISQKTTDNNKNKFYDFIQVELMPAMGTSMVSALNKLHRTINTFTPAFHGIINEFKSAFSECTVMLKGAFGENVRQLTEAVDVMGRNMTLVNENVKKQDELLKTMRQKQTLETIEKFNEAADKFDAVTSSIGKLTDIKDDIAKSSEGIIRAQTDYVEKMAIPERVFEKVNAILDRVTSFEESINALGKDIEHTQLLGNTQMNLIEEQITAIKKKTNLAVNYQEITDEQLKEIYEAQSQVINRINTQYRIDIEKHSDDFKAAMRDFSSTYTQIVNECKRVVEEKRDEYMAEIKRSLDLEAKDKHLAHLDKLDNIQSNLESIRTLVNGQPELIEKLNELNRQVAVMVKTASTTGRQSVQTPVPVPRKKNLFKRMLGR